jgi:hypothetical protein
MQRTRIQRGGVNLDVSSSGKKIWVFRWRETRADGRRVQRKKVIGAEEQYPTKKAAENAARAFRLNLVDGGSEAVVRITMKDLVNHFSEHEQVDKGEEGRAYSTRDRFDLSSIAGFSSVGGKYRSIRFERLPPKIGCGQFRGLQVRSQRSATP